MKKALFLVILLLFIPILTLAWEGCPFSLINDPAPGSCGRFIDTDRDNICDNSQSAPDKRIALAQNSPEKTESLPKVKKVGYDLFPISIVILLVYAFSLVLVRIKKINMLTHRRLWNTLLLISFLAVGLSGIFLVLRVNYGFEINWPFNLLFWHVETGITMAVIAIFHIAWHWPYFKSIFIKKNDLLNKKL